MNHFLDSEQDVVHESGFLWLPLLLDPSVTREIEESPRRDLLLREGGEIFVRTLRLGSLVESGPSIFPGSWEELRRDCLAGVSGELTAGGPAVSDRLKTILFSVMPHFLRRGKSFDRKKLTRDDVLDLVGERLGISGKPAHAARPCHDPAVLRRVLADLGARSPAVEPAPEGRMPARALARWLSTAVVARILGEERERLEKLLAAAEETGGVSSSREAVLLDVARAGALEIDGFGFLRVGPDDDWLIYKRTGAYALADYYGRLYLFPDCRVAVSTAGPLRPFVIESYKHPLLEAHDSGQGICLKRAGKWDAFAGDAAVEALEEGISALLHGYSSRRRNGYHSLEGLLRPLAPPAVQVPGDTRPAGPADDPVARRRHILEVEFGDYRIPADHPDVTSGRVPITNNLLP